MHFPTRIQPIDDSQNDVVFPKQLPPSASKSRLRRLFDFPFRRENDVVGAPPSTASDPSSIYLDKMVRNFIEGSYEKAAKSGKSRCNCFNGNGNNSSEEEDEFDSLSDSVKTNSSSASDSSDTTLKSLIRCPRVVERNLLAETSKIVDKIGKADNKEVAESLISLGYDASICVSKWEKSSSIPAGDYEYIDVVIDGVDRLIVDVDFRSEFEVARPTTSYKQIVQSLPPIFVGKSDRLQIVSIAAEAARQSLRKKGMHVAPWRKAEYMKSKWLGPYTRKLAAPPPSRIDGNADQNGGVVKEKEGKTGVVTWQLPAGRRRDLDRADAANGLASMFKEKTKKKAVL